jgi:hypothetical protein
VDSVWEQKKLEATLREMLDCPKGVPQSPAGRVHHGTMPGNHFPSKNAWLAHNEDARTGILLLRSVGDDLRTLRQAARTYRSCRRSHNPATPFPSCFGDHPCA